MRPEQVLHCHRKLHLRTRIGPQEFLSNGQIQQPGEERETPDVLLTASTDIGRLSSAEAGDAFATESIKWVRYSAKIKSLKERLFDAGWLTVKQVSAKLGLSRSSISKLRVQGKLKGRICNDHGQWLYWLAGPMPNSSSNKTTSVSSTAGDAV